MKTKAKKLTKKQIQKIRADLRALERQLAGAMEDNLGSVKATSREQPTDIMDVAAHDEMDFLKVSSVDSSSTTLREIHVALQKLDEGSYGICDDCGGRITARRLRARPFASLCLECKERQELAGYGGGDVGAGRSSVSGSTISLTGEDSALDDSMSDLFRNVENMETNEIY